MRTHCNDDLCYQLEEKELDNSSYIVVWSDWKEYLQLKEYIEFIDTPSSWKFVVQNIECSNLKYTWIIDLNYFEWYDLSHYQPWDIIEWKYLKPNQKLIEKIMNIKNR